jgi:hypothetical protein
MTLRIAALVLVCGLGALAPVLSGLLHPDVHFNYGPGDESYLEGYEPRWEIDPDGMATHWSTYESHVRLPLRFDGGRFELTYRFSRVYGETAEVELRVNGVPADRFSVRGGAYLERSVVLPASVLSAEPFDLELSVDSHERRNRGLRLDWFQLRAEEGSGRAVPSRSTVLFSALVSLVFFVLTYASLRDLRWSLLLGASLPGAIALYGSLAGLFPISHVIRSTGPTAIGVTLAAMGLVPWARRSGVPLLPVLLAVSFLVRAGGLFHPRYYHPDLRSHADMVEIVSEAGLDFWAHPSRYIAEQGVWTQGAMGETYAFPFSPVFHALFVPFHLDFFSLITAMKLVACLFSALEVLVVFYLGRRLGGVETGMWAAALTVVSPAALSRLSWAFLAAVFAHFLDTLVLASLFPGQKGGRPRTWLVACFLVLALGAYPGSLINFGIFFPILGALLLVGVTPELRRIGLTLLAVSAGVAILVMATVYREFLGTFLTELLPAFLSGESRRGTFSLVQTAAMFVTRYWIFFGLVYLPLVAGGLVLWLRRRPSPMVSRLLLAWGATFAVLIFLRTAAPDLFDKVKEILWIAPLIALAGGETLAWTRRSLPAGRWFAAAYYALVVGYGIVFYVRVIAEKFVLAS